MKTAPRAQDRTRPGSRGARRRSETRRRGRRLRLLWLAAGLGAGALLGPRLALSLAAHWAPEALELREIHVLGSQRLAPEAIARAADLAAGTPLESLDLAAIAGRVADLAWVAEARAAALPPGRLVLGVREHRPVARARDAAGDGAEWWVDAEGRAFAPVTPTDGGPEAAPLLVGVRFEPGEPDATLARGAALAAALRARGLPPAREIALGGAPDETLPSLRLEGLAAAVRLGPEARDEKLARLARLLAAGLAEVASASEIDLRFAGRTVLRGDSASDGAETAVLRGHAAPPRHGPAG